MKTLLAFGLVLVSGAAIASSQNGYDSAMLDCLDYYHSPKSQEEILACHEQVKQSILQSDKASQEYNSCVDYGHGKITFEEDVACLQKVSQ